MCPKAFAIDHAKIKEEGEEEEEGDNDHRGVEADEVVPVDSVDDKNELANKVYYYA